MPFVKWDSFRLRKFSKFSKIKFDFKKISQFGQFNWLRDCTQFTLFLQHFQYIFFANQLIVFTEFTLFAQSVLSFSSFSAVSWVGLVCSVSQFSQFSFAFLVQLHVLTEIFVLLTTHRSRNPTNLYFIQNLVSVGG